MRINKNNVLIQNNTPSHIPLYPVLLLLTTPIMCRVHSYDSTEEGFSPFITSDDKESSFVRMIANHTLTAAITFSSMETLFKTQLSNGTLANIYGSSNVAYGVLMDLQEIFHFRLKITPSAGWIGDGGNDTLTGVGFQVHSGQVDIGLDISKPTTYRARHLTFLHAIKQDRVAIMFRQPKIQMRQNILIRPFKDGSWKRVLHSVFILILSAALIYRRRDLHTILLPVIGAILARSVDFAAHLSPSAKSLHIVFLVSSLFGLTMYSIYSAFIVSSLKRYTLPVRKFQDLIEFGYELQAQKTLPDFTNVYMSDEKVGKIFATNARKNFISEKDSLRRLFYPGNDNDDAVSQEKFVSGSNPGIAWFVLKSDFYYLALQNNFSTRQICHISKLEPTSRPEHPRPLSMFVKKERNETSRILSNQAGGIDGIKEHFNRKILDILARGLGDRHIVRYETEFQPKCVPTNTVRFQQVQFNDVYTAYLVLIYGAIIALGIMIIAEILFSYFWRMAEQWVKITSGRRCHESKYGTEQVTTILW